MEQINAKIDETVIAYMIFLIIGYHIFLNSKKSVLRNRVLEYIGIVHLYLTSYLITMFRVIFDNVNIIPVIYFTEILKFISVVGMSGFTFVVFQHLLRTRLFNTTVTEAITMIPLCITILFYISTPITKLTFSVNPDKSIIPGPLYIFPYILSLIYNILCSVIIIKAIYKSYNPQERRFAANLSILIVTPLISRYVSTSFGVPIQEITLAIAFLVFYLDFIKRDVSTDRLTGLNNRRFLIYEVNSLMKRIDRKKLVLLMIDANKFKSINDNYGHLEGDAALKRIATAIEQCTYFLKHCTISRYGGDEFIICFLERQSKDGRLIALNIEKTLEKINKNDNAKSNVNVSIGIAKYDPSFTNAEDFIKAADDALYNVKKEKSLWNTLN